MKLATIERIHSVQPHFNADSLEVAKIKEWPVVVKKGEYKNGDLVVFIRIDSIVPSANSYFSFLERQKYRVWNAKFRGSPSQGLVCPLTIIPSYNYQVEEGSDVSEALGILKYDKPIDSSVNGDAKGSFPTHLISITDEENIQNYPEILEEFRNELCYLTIKADGSSMTVIYENGEVRVCSRRLEQKEGTGFWKIADQYNLTSKLKELGKNIAIQAEACGGKIQGNPLGLNSFQMFVFNVKEFDTGKWYNWQEINELCNQLQIPVVIPVSEPFTFDDTWTMARLQEEANKAIYLTSTGQERKAEGIVLRPITPKYSPILGKSLSVKILNQDY